jgi:hypothetical protein
MKLNMSMTLDYTLEKMKRTRKCLAPLELPTVIVTALTRSLIPFDQLVDMAKDRPEELLEIKLISVERQQRFIEALIQHRYIDDR